MASLLLVSLGVGAVRFLLALPVAAKAEWIFRMTEFAAPAAYRKASARFLLWLGCLPVWLLLSATALAIWPGWRSFVFLLVIGLFSLLLITASTLALRQIPFARSYAPGRGQVHLVFWTALLLLLPTTRVIAAVFHRGLESPAKAVLLILVVFGAWRALVLRGRGLEAETQGLVFAGDTAEPLQALHLG